MSKKYDKTKLYGSPDFYKIIDNLKKLYSEKNFQYATQNNPFGNFQRCGKLIKKLLNPNIDEALADAMILMSKQIDAVYEMVGEGKTGTVESVDKKFEDIAVYCIICKILYRESKQ